MDGVRENTRGGIINNKCIERNETQENEMIQKKKREFFTKSTMTC